MNRRSILSTTALIAPALAVAGCASLATTAGTAVGIGVATKVISYVQAGVASLNAVLTNFGSSMSASAYSTASTALNDLSTVANTVGTAIASSADALTTGTAVGKVSTVMQIAIAALKVGLALVPGASAALQVVNDVALIVPVIEGLATQIITPSATVKVSAPVTLPVVVRHLGVMVPS